MPDAAATIGLRYHAIRQRMGAMYSRIMAIQTDRPLLQAAIDAVERNDLQRADALFLEYLAKDRADPIALADYGDFCLRTGRPANACYLLYKADALCPGNSDLLTQLGYAQLETQDFDSAKRSFEAVLAGSPEYAQACYGLALCHQQAGAWAAAVESFANALATQPDTLPILLSLASACLHAGDSAQARIHFEHAEKIAPDDPAMLLGYGKFLREQGETSHAMLLIDRLAREHPDEEPVLLEKARCLRALGDFSQSIRWLERLDKVSPDLPDCEEELGNCLQSPTDRALRDQHWANAVGRWLRAGELRHAETLLGRLLTSSPLNASAWNLRGLLENASHRLDAAENAYREAIAIDPANLDACANLAHLYESTNRVAEAKAVAEDGLGCIGIGTQQQNAIIELTLASCKVERRLKNYPLSLKLLDRIESFRPSDLQRQSAYFERGKLMDLCGDAADAIAAFTPGNALALAPWQRENPGKTKFLAGVEHMLDLAGKGWLCEWEPVRAPTIGANPAFLIGFPRSGTTLLNHVLDSHGAIRTMEEKPPAQDLMDAVRSMPKGYPNALPDFDAFDITYLREVYFRSAAREGVCDSSLLVLDKFPLHTTMAGLLHRVFPQAKFLFAIRHPCDVVLSCFMQNFKLNEAMANFCTIADTVALYTRTMDLWEMYRTQLPLTVHTIRYEDVVDDFDGQIRALCDFLQVPWEEGLRQFSTRALDRGRINTPSYEQVGKPIYREARYRWERYREHLESFLPALQPYIERFGYSDSTRSD